VRIVDVNQLLTLPSSLLKVPAHVFEVYLCGVKPRDLDTDWPEEASCFACEYNNYRHIILYVMFAGCYSYEILS
jgi:hypothetical protein